MAGFRLSAKAWKAICPPTDVDRKREAMWLREHSDYGGAIHETAARAIEAALAEPSSREVGHALFFKLFSEFANALEVAGAWGWVIRTRRDHPLLLDGFLTYPNSAPRDFYRAALRNRSGSLVLLLKLPAEPTVVGALTAAHPEWTVADCRRSLAECVGSAKFLAGRYFDTGEIIRATYNRAKHGVTLLHDPRLTPREFYVIQPHFDVAGPRDTARYDLPRFTVNKTMIRAIMRGTTIASATIRYLAGLASALNEAGALYPRRRY